MTKLDSILKSRDITLPTKVRLSQGYCFSSSCVWMWELDCEESRARKNWCFWTVMLEKAFESPLDCKEIQPVHPKGDQSWVFIERTDVEAETLTLATWCEELTYLKRPWCWKRLKAGGEGDDWRWDGWMASPTQWTWVWVNSGSWWWTGRPGMLQSMGSERVGHDWATELNWTETCNYFMTQKLHSWAFIPEKWRLILTQNLYKNVYSNFIPNNPKLETTQMTCKGWMVKQTVCLHTTEVI